MATFTLRIVSPEKVVLEAEVDAVRFPGEDGFIGVLAKHAPMVALTESEILTAKMTGGENLELLIHDGFAEVRNDVLTVLTRSAEEPREVDLERAREAAERAEQRLQLNRAEYDHARAMAALRRAIARQKYGSRS